MARELAVHCCCEPGKRLGWLQLPSSFAGDVKPGRIVRIAWATREHDASASRLEQVFEPGCLVLWELDLEIRMLHYAGDTILALDSHELTPEQWRTIPGFREDVDVWPEL